MGCLAGLWPRDDPSDIATIATGVSLYSVLRLPPTCLPSHPGNDPGCVSRKLDICILSSFWHPLVKEECCAMAVISLRGTPSALCFPRGQQAPRLRKSTVFHPESSCGCANFQCLHFLWCLPRPRDNQEVVPGSLDVGSGGTLLFLHLYINIGFVTLSKSPPFSIGFLICKVAKW